MCVCVWPRITDVHNEHLEKLVTWRKHHSGACTLGFKRHKRVLNDREEAEECERARLHVDV